MTAFSKNNTKTTATKAKNPIRKRRPRRALPEDLTDFFIADGDRPSTLDVVGGRGGVSNNHEGNKRYWIRILAERPEYKQLGKNDNAEKNEIAQAIYDYILSTGGRFLQLDTKTQKWFNLPQKVGLDKIKQALRDKYVPNFIEDESQSAMTENLPTPLATTEGDKEEFLAFLNQAPVNPKTDFTSTPSIDLGSILGQSSLDNLDLFKSGDFLGLLSKPSLNQLFQSQNRNSMKSFELNIQRNSLDNLLRGDLIATCDNMAPVSMAPQAPMSLQSMLQQTMESAIPSSRTVAV